jgi:ribosome-binding factor A
MPHGSRRLERVAEAIREEVARFLQEGAKDPRIRGLVTVTGVDVTPDLRHAAVFVSVLGSAEDKKITFDGLASLAGHLRGGIARSLRLRFAPELEFREDASIDHAARIEKLLAQLKDGKAPTDDQSID